MRKVDESLVPDVSMDYKDYPDIIEGGKRGFVNQCNYVGATTEKFTLPSMTVPDMSLSLRDMLERHKNGGKVKTFQVANVPEQSMIPDDFERMTPIDRAVFKQQVADFIATTRGRIISAREARRRAEFQSLVDQAAEKRLRDVAALGQQGSDQQ